MSFIWNLISKAKITEEMLKEHSIEILEDAKLAKDLSNNPLVTTAFGKFYKGLYDDQEITYKIVDITLNENIINELILWKKYQNSPNGFLTLKGVVLYYNSVYIIFKDHFKYTLDSLLLYQKKKNINKIQIIKIAKQILDIINILQKDNQINTDLRPGSFIINSEQKVKLIDFGIMLKIPDFPNKEAIQNEHIKYSPPEYLLENKIDISYDIYSFGCILIDLFSTDQNSSIIKKTYDEYEDYINDILEDKYPNIPSDFNYLLQEIIKRCINKDPNQRIKINELYYNLNILLDYLSIFNNKDNNKSDKNNINNLNIDLKNEELIENKQNIQFKNLYNFSKEINLESIKYEDIDNKLKEQIEKIKKDLDNGYKNSLIQLDKLKEKLKSKIDEVINKNEGLITSFYNKNLENIIYFINLLSNSMTDIIDINKTAPEIQLLLLSYNKFINKTHYQSVEDVINSWKNDIEKRVKKYTNNKYYDIIDLSFDKCEKFVKKSEELTNNYFIELNKLGEIISNMKGFFGNDDKIEKELDDQLLVQKLINGVNFEDKIEDIKNENDPDINPLTNIIYAKIVENSNMISIFDYDKKELKNYTIFDEKDEKNKNFKFNSNCFSIFRADKNCIYVSGGTKDIKNPNSHDNSFFRLDIIRDKNKSSKKYEFKLKKLCKMNNPRSYHSMINLSEEKNTILSISGINTDSCEVYNIDYDNWELIQELPMKCQNPGLIDYNDYLFVFPYTIEYNNIFRMNITSGDFVWESIKYSINEGSLKQGMIVIPNDNNLFLLGGYNNEGNYSHVYEICLDNENNDNEENEENKENKSIDENNIINENKENKQMDIKLSTELSLPNEIYFNSNYLEFNINQENNAENNVLILDNYNGVLEFKIDSREFNYYLGK